MKYRLFRKSVSYTLSSQKKFVGRNEDCCICVNEATVSRLHAELEVDEQKSCLLIRDLGSANGTFVDGKPIASFEIFGPATIKFGRSEFFVHPEDDSTCEATPKDISTISSFCGEGLTPTEQVVLEFLLRGISERDTADKLFVSHHTVHNHVRSIYKKLKVKSRAELMALFIDKEMSGQPATKAMHKSPRANKSLKRETLR